jgi:Protein of unknown function (DUF2946)
VSVLWGRRFKSAKAVHGFFRKRPWQKRLVALAAAYAIALAGLIANFGGAQMAAAAAAQPGGIICHTDFAGGHAPSPAPSPDGGTNKTCTDDCCTGCLTLAAALPPAPAHAETIPPSASMRIALPAVAAFVASPQTKSHQSRAPPRMA